MAYTCAEFENHFHVGDALTVDGINGTFAGVVDHASMQ